MTRRKRTEQHEVKSTVMTVRDSYDWGRILYDACYLFNKGFAEYLEEYARKYDNGDIVLEDAGREAASLIAKRDRLIEEKNRLHDAVRLATATKNEAYRRYARAMPLGEAVVKWRRSSLRGEAGDSRYAEMLGERNELKRRYHDCVELERKALADERRHVDGNLFLTRTLNYKVRSISKMMDRHGIPLGHPMMDDVPALKSLILSEQQTERLMAVCLNILNTYSEREFSIMLDNVEREHVSEGIYDFFSEFEHNYDFLAGCYDVDESTGLLRLKPADVLASKIYNGYYFTIRGYVQRSYAKVRFERFNIESVDANWTEEDDNGNHGVDRLTANGEGSLSYSNAAPKVEPLDEGLLDCWHDCNDYLMENVGSMSSELAGELARRFPRNPYYNGNDATERMTGVMSSAIGMIDRELVSGNVIGNRLKHIILDAMGGAESTDEWKQNVSLISDIMTKYMTRFFSGGKEKTEDDRKEVNWR